MKRNLYETPLQRIYQLNLMFFFFFLYIQLILQNAVALKRKGGFVKNKKLNHKTSAYESRKSH